MTYPNPAKLSAHIAAVKSVMYRKGWMTLDLIEIRLYANGVNLPTQSVSARVRDLRKARYGSHIVERRYAGSGVYEYRLGKGAK